MATPTPAPAASEEALEVEPAAVSRNPLLQAHKQLADSAPLSLEATEAAVFSVPPQDAPQGGALLVQGGGGGVWRRYSDEKDTWFVSKDTGETSWELPEGCIEERG